jgi:hypothetical protein
MAESPPETLLKILVPVLGARLPQLGFIRLYHEGAWFSKGLAAVETHRPEGIKVPLHAYAFIKKRYKELKTNMRTT